jgi:hypothetical protein
VCSLLKDPFFFPFSSQSLLLLSRDVACPKLARVRERAAKAPAKAAAAGPDKAQIPGGGGRRRYFTSHRRFIDGRSNPQLSVGGTPNHRALFFLSPGDFSPFLGPEAALLCCGSAAGLVQLRRSIRFSGQRRRFPTSS